MRLQQWAIMAFALLAILTSVHSTSTSNEDVQPQRQSLPVDDADRQLSPPRRLATPTTSPTVIVITTPESDPYTFTGMPATLKAGTYTFKYINNSDVGHNFKIRGAGGFRKTPVCSKCTYSMTVTLKRYVNGVLAPNRLYVCEPHASSMKGTVKITA
jgi:plastocyanin